MFAEILPVIAFSVAGFVILGWLVIIVWLVVKRR